MFRVVFLSHTEVFVFRLFPSDNNKLNSGFKVSETTSNIFVYNIKNGRTSILSSLLTSMCV